ncbi:S-adenosyl-L-methionine-dependent methyltransferase [Apiospora arundinis]
MDLQHALFTLALDGHLALAPMQSTPKHVINVATGTGIWALDFGMYSVTWFLWGDYTCLPSLWGSAPENPAACVIGTDLSMIQPTPKDVDVHNCEFIRDDAEEEWVFPNFTFDYVHIRAVALAFQNPRAVLGNARKNLSPGGWVEYQDLDPTARSYD